jgi:hypothetical protein
MLMAALDLVLLVKGGKGLLQVLGLEERKSES